VFTSFLSAESSAGRPVVRVSGIFHPPRLLAGLS
jgi:hypothetical protein